jgi:ElaB/YqjD/DUF883 family membrane-anchored ribosome-binding protein
MNTRTHSQRNGLQGNGNGQRSARRGASSRRTRSQVTDLADMSKERLASAARSARQQGRAIERQARDFSRNNPLLLGVAGIVIGIGIGMVLPMTFAEGRMFGNLRDGIRNNARTFAENAMGKVQGAAKQIGNLTGSAHEDEEDEEV